MQRPRVYAGISLLRERPEGERRLRLFSCPLVASAEANPLLRKSTFPQKSNSTYLEIT